MILLAVLLSAGPVEAREVGRVHALGHAAVKIEAGGTVIYIDPYRLTSTPADADLILITHNHTDHLSVSDINRVRKSSTTFIASQSCVATLQQNFPAATVIAASPGWQTTIGGLGIAAVPSYNIVKTNHPKASNFVGFVVTVEGVRVYHAGDTERIPEMQTFTCDVAMVPLGQTYTMTSVQEAVDAVLDLKAKTAIPIHWGVAEGTLADANQFAALLSGRVQVVINTGDGFALEAPNPPVIQEHPASQTVAPGGTVTFRVQATGTGALAYLWQRNGQPVSGATRATLMIGTLTAAHAGDYTVVVTDANGSTTSRPATLVVETPAPGRLVNLSVRTTLASGQTLIVGFVTDGAKPVLVRGVGPGMHDVFPQFFGAGDVLSDPRLELYNAGGVKVDENDNWSSSLAVTMTSVGAFSLTEGSKDAALVATINGQYTAQLKGSGSGVVLVDGYDTTSSFSPRLQNVSARNQVATGANILIAGFVIDGNVPKTLLIRGIGPALFDVFGVSGALADPKLELYRQEGATSTKVAENDTWDSSLTTTFDTVGAYHFKAGSKDAALLVTLLPGVYTAQVSGVGGTTGDGVVEVYEIP